MTPILTEFQRQHKKEQGGKASENQNSISTIKARQQKLNLMTLQGVPEELNGHLHPPHNFTSPILSSTMRRVKFLTRSDGLDAKTSATRCEATANSQVFVPPHGMGRTYTRHHDGNVKEELSNVYGRPSDYKRAHNALEKIVKTDSSIFETDRNSKERGPGRSRREKRFLELSVYIISTCSCFPALDAWAHSRKLWHYRKSSLYRGAQKKRHPNVFLPRICMPQSNYTTLTPLESWIKSW